jgi:hypothetical protein
MIEAARNNAEWCDTFCRTHGISGVFGAEFWSAASRTPPYYPDAITLSPATDAAVLIRSVDASAGCTVKDSFACLDLTPYGFEVLFEAQWIVRQPSGRNDSPLWTIVRDTARLREWELALGGDGGLFRPELLTDERVTIFASMERSSIVGGCVANASGSLVGLSNVFGDYAAAVAVVSGCFPERTLVGSESGGELELALRAGFRPAGPLRIWSRP